MLTSAVMLVACGGGTRGNQSAGREQAEAPEDATAEQPAPAAARGQVATGEPMGRIRVVNAIAVKDGPPAIIDLYDVARPGPGSTPLVKGLQYGQASDYVAPCGWGPGAPSSNLYAFRAGSTEQGSLLGAGQIDFRGFVKGDQLTLVLYRSQLNFGIQAIAEAGSRVRRDDPGAPTGKGLLLVQSALSDSDDPKPELHLAIDGACPNPNAFDGRVPVAPGDHTIAVVTTPNGQGLTTCAGQTPVASVDTHLDAGQRLDVIGYGPPNAVTLLIVRVAN